jgi:hypothetical protein
MIVMAQDGIAWALGRMRTALFHLTPEVVLFLNSDVSLDVSSDVGSTSVCREEASLCSTCAISAQAITQPK